MSVCNEHIPTPLPKTHRGGECLHMARTTVTFTVSLPPQMAAELEDVMRREHRTRSELVREALRQYVATSIDAC